MNSIDELAAALQGIADKATELLGGALDRLNALRNQPRRYVGRHRAPTVFARLSTRWASWQAERELDRRHTSELADLAEWWAARRVDYAPARGRVLAGARA